VGGENGRGANASSNNSNSSATTPVLSMPVLGKMQ
jgi:hypothetical protein